MRDNIKKLEEAIEKEKGKLKFYKDSLLGVFLDQEERNSEEYLKKFSLFDGDLHHPWTLGLSVLILTESRSD